MSIAFDQVGTVGTAASGTTVSCTDSATAGAVSLFWVFWASTTNNGGVTAEYGSTSMTQVGSTLACGNQAGFNTFLALFEITAPGGGGTVTATTAATIGGAKVSSISYTGVGSVGSLVANAGSTSAATSSSVTSASGHLVTNADFQFSSSPAFSSYSGTQRIFDNGGAFACGMLFGDTAGSSSVSFSVNSNTANLFGIGAIDLIPPTGITCSPTTATVAVTGGTPALTFTLAPTTATVTVTGDNAIVLLSGNLNPTTATIGISGGTPTITLPAGETPTTATIHVTGGTPTIANSYGPLAPMLNKLALGQSTIIQVLGDSTAFGDFDTGWDDVDTPWLPGTLAGWAGRLCIALGEYFGATVHAHYWNYPTNSAYGSVNTLYTASGTPPTITLYLGGWPGATLGNLIGANTAMMPASTADVVIVQDGFNEPSTSTFATNYPTYIGEVKTNIPGAPIIVTTANATTITEESGPGVPFADIWATMIDLFLSTDPSQPLSPALQASNVTAGVWVLDTQQAGQNAATLNTDGLHPIAPGYAEQAQFMLNHLTSIPALVELSGLIIPVTANAISITGGTPSFFIGAALTPTTATITVTGGTPVLVFTVSPPTARITITGSTPTLTGATAITTPTTAVIAVHAGTPLVINGDPIQEIAFFTVQGFWYDVQAPPTGGTTNDAVFTGITGGNATFTARVPAGFTVLIANLDLGSGNIGSTALALPPITGVVAGTPAENGGMVWQLCANNAANSPGIELLANTTAVSAYLAQENVWDGQLIYDVKFTDVTFAGANHNIEGFAFAAPNSSTSVTVTDSGFAMLPYEGP